MAIQIMEISLGYLSKNTYLCPENLRFRFMQDTNISSRWILKNKDIHKSFIYQNLCECPY